MDYINEITFLAKIVALWVIWLFVRWAWDLAVKKTSHTPFAAEIFASSDDRGLTQLWTQASWGEIGRRFWLLRLAFSPVLSRVNALILVLVVYQVGVRGGLMDLNEFLRAAEPPEWVFWLGETQPVHLGLCFIVGALLTAVFLHPYLPTILALALTFNGIISLAGALLLIQGERWAIRILFAWFFRSKIKRTDFALVVGIHSVLSLMMIAWSREFFISLSSAWQVDGFHAGHRFFVLGLGHAFWIAVESVVLAAVYHFYFQRSRDEKMLDTFPAPPVLWAGWLSRWLRSAVMIRVLQRFQSLESMTKELDGDRAREKIPGPVLARMEKERREMRKILKA